MENDSSYWPSPDQEHRHLKGGTLREVWKGDVCADLPICVTLSDEKEISAQYRISKEEQYLRGWENNFYRKLTFIEIESGYLPLCFTNLLLYRVAESARSDEAAKGIDR